jgi:hypothetical protein
VPSLNVAPAAIFAGIKQDAAENGKLFPGRAGQLFPLSR